MEPKEIKELVDSAVKAAFTEMEISKNLEELKGLRVENKTLKEKLSSVENAEIPAEKVEEITAVVEKAIGEKVDSIVGEALEKATESFDNKVTEAIGTFEETVEEAKTNRERIKEALSQKRAKCSSAFKPMSRQSIAYTQCSDDKELEAISEALKNAKTKKEIEDVKNLLQAFITSSKKVAISEDLQKEIDDDLAELDAYRELGTIDEIEAAVEVIETYADEIGSLKKLSDEVKPEEKMEIKEKVEFEESRKQSLASRRRALISRRRALASRRKAIASRRKALIAHKKEVAEKKQVKTSSKRAELVKSRKEALIKARKEALASRREEKATETASNNARLEKIKALKERRTKLAGIKEQIKENLTTSVSSKNAPGALATSLFQKK